MEVDEMIGTIESTLEKLRRNLDVDAERHYDHFIYRPKIGITQTEQYASAWATEELKIIAKLEEMLQTLEEVV
jgi:hypothetical protein